MKNCGSEREGRGNQGRNFFEMRYLEIAKDVIVTTTFLGIATELAKLLHSTHSFLCLSFIDNLLTKCLGPRGLVKSRLQILPNLHGLATLQASQGRGRLPRLPA